MIFTSLAHRSCVFPCFKAALLAASLTGILSAADDQRAAGVAALAAGDWELASGSLAVHVSRMPTDADAWTLLGVARWHAGRPDEALEALRRALAGGTALDAKARYYLGLCLYDLNRDDDALVAFRELAHRHPGSPEAERARLAIGQEDAPALAEPGPRNRWWIRAEGSATLDSNPDRLDPRQTPDDDPDWILGTSLELGFVAVPRHLELWTGASWDDYQRRDDLDTLVLSGGAWLGWQPGAHDELGLDLAAYRTWMDRLPLRTRMEAIGMWWHGFDDSRWTRVELGIQRQTYDQTEDEGLDGQGGHASLQLGWDGATNAILRRAYLDVGADQDDTTDPQLVSTGLTAEAIAIWQPHAKWILETGIEAGGRRYGPGWGVPSGHREDTWLGLRLDQTWRLAKPIALFANTSYRTVTSNDDLYSYKLTMLSVGVRVTF